jgi:hypothetical protein
MKLFGNSVYGKTVTNKEKNVSTSYGSEDNIFIIKMSTFKGLSTIIWSKV